MPWTDLPRGQRREVVLRRVGGEGFPAEVSIHPIPLENSSGFAIFIRDVTLRHRAEAALREAKSAAEDASRVKSEFMANVSHEIRTPLGGITGSAELLAQMELTPKAQQYVEMIRDSGELLSGVIGDILDLASIEAGRLKINPQATDLHRCLSEPFRALATKAMGKDLELILHIRPDVPRVALVDANRLRQVVINLAGNAIKFTPKGHVWFRVGIDHLADAKPNRWLRLEMIDSGIGIADVQLRKIFRAVRAGRLGDDASIRRDGFGPVDQRPVDPQDGRNDRRDQPPVARQHLLLPVAPAGDDRWRQGRADGAQSDRLRVEPTEPLVGRARYPAPVAATSDPRPASALRLQHRSAWVGPDHRPIARPPSPRQSPAQRPTPDHLAGPRR
jgi:GAF domain-containing protein